MSVTLSILSPQATASFKITDQPQMPSVGCKARLTGYTGGRVLFTWKATVNWIGKGAKTTGEFTGTSSANGDAVTTWSIPWGAKFYGGDIELEVVASIQTTAAGKSTYSRKGRAGKIIGTQPKTQAIKAELGTSPWYLARMARAESRIRQFDKHGAPVLNTIGDGGVGILQITGKNQTDQDVWNWRHNVKTGRALLQSQAKTASAFWKRQLQQFNAWNKKNPKQKVAPPADITYNNITFSFGPTGTQKSFATAIAIKMFNGAAKHFIVWDNVGAQAKKPRWRVNDTNNFSKNYVEAVCKQPP